MTPSEARRVLGLHDRDAHGLRAAFRQAVRSDHPDAPGGDAARFRAVVEAYSVLSRTSTGEATSPGPARPTGRPPEPPADDRVPGPDDPGGDGLADPLLDDLVRGLDIVGAVTYADASASLIEGVITQFGPAIQVLLAGTGRGRARVVDVVRLDAGTAPSVAQVEGWILDASEHPAHRPGPA